MITPRHFTPIGPMGDFLEKAIDLARAALLRCPEWHRDTTAEFPAALQASAWTSDCDRTGRFLIIFWRDGGVPRAEGTYTNINECLVVRLTPELCSEARKQIEHLQKSAGAKPA